VTIQERVTGDEGGTMTNDNNSLRVPWTPETVIVLLLIGGGIVAAVILGGVLGNTQTGTAVTDDGIPVEIELRGSASE
jgi:type III secretory pathway component EscS